MAKSCSIDGCEKPVRARGWCSTHYRRWRLYGSTAGPDRRTLPKPRIERCTLEGCEKAYVARGLCGMHYRRLRVNGGPLVTKVRRKDTRPCLVAGCGKPRDGRGLCSMHYKRWQIHGDPMKGALEPAAPDVETICEWCGKTVIHRPGKPRQFCGNRCRAKAWAAKRPGRITTPRGYVALWMPEHPQAHKNGYILEHRYFMGEQLGRPLRTDEDVHHKNGVRDDNRLENLEVMSSSDHVRLHAQLGRRK